MVERSSRSEYLRSSQRVSDCARIARNNVVRKYREQVPTFASFAVSLVVLATGLVSGWIGISVEFGLPWAIRWMLSTFLTLTGLFLCALASAAMQTICIRRELRHAYFGRIREARDFVREQDAGPLLADCLDNRRKFWLYLRAFRPEQPHVRIHDGSDHHYLEAMTRENRITETTILPRFKRIAPGFLITDHAHSDLGSVCDLPSSVFCESTRWSELYRESAAAAGLIVIDVVDWRQGGLGLMKEYDHLIDSGLSARRGVLLRKAAALPKERREQWLFVLKYPEDGESAICYFEDLAKLEAIAREILR